MTNQDERLHALARARQRQREDTILRRRDELAAWIDATLKIAVFSAECGVLPVGTILQRRLKELASRVAAVDRLEGEGGLGELLKDGDAEHRFNAVRTAVLERQAEVTELAALVDAPAEKGAVPVTALALLELLGPNRVTSKNTLLRKENREYLGAIQIQRGGQTVFAFPMPSALHKARERWPEIGREKTKPKRSVAKKTDREARKAVALKPVVLPHRPD